jgi:hypothetical protein
VLPDAFSVMPRVLQACRTMFEARNAEWSISWSQIKGVLGIRQNESVQWRSTGYYSRGRAGRGGTTTIEYVWAGRKDDVVQMDE